MKWETMNYWQWRNSFRVYWFNIDVYSFRDAPCLVDIVEDISNRNNLRAYVQGYYVSTRLGIQEDDSAVSPELQKFKKAHPGKLFKHQNVSGVSLRRLKMKAYVSRYLRDRKHRAIVYSPIPSYYWLSSALRQHSKPNEFLKYLGIVPEKWHGYLTEP